MKYRQTDNPPAAAAKSSFSSSTAYRFEKDPRLPSQKKGGRDRRRPDPLADVFETEVVPMLKAAPGVRSVAIFEEMLRRHPELGSGVRRTLVTDTFSRGTTATTENWAPSGFQHLVQPQT